ncbi:MAG: ABC transporter ATP-binding protein [Bifidobacteriaceae bacterium]|nr:ABC transporter ATP-binding protein [Bifidobacteriaceae bacterium]
MPSSTRTVVKVDGLVKRFGDLTAVDSISFEVRPGELFAFLGPNGSGKTTTIRCLTTLDRPDAGEIWVAGNRLGQADDAIRRSIGVVFQERLLDDKLTVRENLTVRAELYGFSRAQVAERIEELGKQIEIAEFLDQRYGTLSGGQSRRADVARALIHRPEVVFMDEPTAGLDPLSRDQVWKTVNSLRTGSGTTIFLTTHYLAETEDADYVVMLDHGQAIERGTPQALREKFSTSILTLTAAEDFAGAEAQIRRALEPWPSRDVGGAIRAEVDSAATARQLLADLGAAVGDFEFRHGTMDDVFLSLTENEPEVGAGAGGAASGSKKAGGTGSKGGPK